MKLRTSALISVALMTGMAGSALANCDSGEMVIKFSHVTNTDKHPKGIAATLLEQRVNDEMNGTACMEVFPNSVLYNDDKVLEAMLTETCNWRHLHCQNLKNSPSNSGFSIYHSCFRTLKPLTVFRTLIPVRQ